jgi:hypothetical protein
METSAKVGANAEISVFIAGGAFQNGGEYEYNASKNHEKR